MSGTAQTQHQHVHSVREWFQARKNPQLLLQHKKHLDHLNEEKYHLNKKICFDYIFNTV